VATFAARDEAREEILVFRDEGVSDQQVEAALRRGVAGVFAQGAGLEILHAGAVAHDRGVIGFCGESGSGKSTIAYALSLRGYPQWADDALAFDALVGNGQASAYPLPFEPRLRPEPTQHFKSPVNHAYGFGSGPRHLAAVFILDRQQDAEQRPAKIMPTVAAERFVMTFAHASYLDLPTDERRRAMVEQFLALAACTPAFTVSFSSGLETLGALLDRLEEYFEMLP
jgi:hypothetical protein